MTTITENKFDWAKRWRVDMDMSDEQGEAAILAVKKDMPSKVQTRYNQRDIEKRKAKNYGIQNTRR
jgi:hypothetical protein